MKYAGIERRINGCSNCSLMKKSPEKAIGKLQELTEILAGKDGYKFSNISKPIVIILENNDIIKEKLKIIFDENYNLKTE